ncbi:MAG: hypothetical protein JW806_02955 [Sedimentisphaerales bacterium]|nr:hypothetical protein [Sedimentisphaerales bacterium]
MSLLRRIKQWRSGKRKLSIAQLHKRLIWYPSSRDAQNTGPDSSKPVQMPPLMVRRAAWRK